MDIYIKNIEIPITCRDCPIGNPKLKTCYLLNEPKLNLERRSDCPLIAVSPHGDLVDRNNLLEKAYYDYNEATHDYNKFRVVFEDDIIDAPVVIEGSL